MVSDSFPTIRMSHWSLSFVNSSTSVTFRIPCVCLRMLGAGPKRATGNTFSRQCKKEKERRNRSVIFPLWFVYAYFLYVFCNFKEIVYIFSLNITNDEMRFCHHDEYIYIKHSEVLAKVFDTTTALIYYIYICTLIYCGNSYIQSSLQFLCIFSLP